MDNIKVKQITYNEAKPFIENIHYARKMPCVQYAFGLFNSNNKIIGVVTYGQPASPSVAEGIIIDGDKHRDKILELNRLVIIVHDNKNYASYLVSHSLRMLPKNMFIVSYADTAWGHVGYVYQATNWLYTGMTKERTDIYSESGHARHACGDVSKRQIRSAKYRYVYLTGNKKQQLKQLKCNIIKEYPKGDSLRYDITNPIPNDKRIIKKETSHNDLFH